MLSQVLHIGTSQSNKLKVREWRQWGGFDLVDLNLAENNRVVTSILAYFETKFFDLFNNIYKYPTPQPSPTRSLKGAVETSGGQIIDTDYRSRQ